MSYLAGFQALEQRDSDDLIVVEGVVSKRSPFASSDNTGIYDIIAEDLRYLNEQLEQVKSSNDLSSIRDDIKSMYNAMITDSNFGSVEAKAQAEVATEQANIATNKAQEVSEALSSFLKDKSSIDDNILILQDYIKSVKNYLDTVSSLREDIQSNTQVSINKALEATEEAVKAFTSEASTKLWAEASDSPDGTQDADSPTEKTMSAKSWGLFSKDKAQEAKISEENSKKSEANSKASEDNAKTSEDNAKTSEDNAKVSEENAKDSENEAKQSETNCNDMLVQARETLSVSKEYTNIAFNWAEGDPSKEKTTDEEGNETVIEHFSSKHWANESKNSAINSKASETNAKVSEGNAKVSETNAKNYQERTKDYSESANNSATNAKIYSETSVAYSTNAKNSASQAKASENMAKAWAESSNSPDGEFDSDNSSGHTLSAKGWAKVAKSISETTKGYEDATKEYMNSAKASVEENKKTLDTVKALQENTDSLYQQSKEYLKEAKNLKESMSNAVSYRGTVKNYSDLPTDNRVGDMYCVKNADEEHGINANDKVIWNGTTWDNSGGGVDDTVFARQGDEVSFKKVTAESFVGSLDGNAKSADTAKSVDWNNVKGRPEKFVADGGRADTADVCTGNSATASKANKADCDGEGKNIVETYVNKETFSSETANFKSQYLHVRERNKDYAVGDICNSAVLPSWAYLECVTAGTTAGKLDETLKYDLGAVVEDGTASFIVRKHGGHGKSEIWAVVGNFNEDGFFIDPVYGVDLSVHICDGTHGTPDLRDRVIIGSGGSYANWDKGGEATHTLTVAEMPSHNHSASSNSTGAHTHTTTCYKTTTNAVAYVANKYGIKLNNNSFNGKNVSSFSAGGTLALDSAVSVLTGGAGRASNSAGAHAHTITVNANGSDGAHNNMQPFYAFAYVGQIK